MFLFLPWSLHKPIKLVKEMMHLNALNISQSENKLLGFLIKSHDFQFFLQISENEFCNSYQAVLSIFTVFIKPIRLVFAVGGHQFLPGPAAEAHREGSYLKTKKIRMRMRTAFLDRRPGTASLVLESLKQKTVKLLTMPKQPKDKTGAYAICSPDH
jgi:hypothetical protein